MKNQPDWFIKSLKTEKKNKSLEVQGATINFQQWGDPKNQGLVLVHGTGAHSHWWDFIAPLFIDQYEVVALDLSGMGDSDHRKNYNSDLFAKEILAVAESVNLFSNHRPYKPVICGHSLGGWMSATAGYIAKEKVSGVIMIDSPIRPPTFDYSRHRGSGPIRKIKTYPTKEAILERFRLAPEQPCKNKFILDYIANWSIKKVKKGFEWKFDDTLFEKLQPARGDREVAFKLDCNLGIIYGSNSPMMSEEVMNYMRSNVKEGTPIIPIEDSYHHVPLDQPIRLIEEIRSVIDSWK